MVDPASFFVFDESDGAAVPPIRVLCLVDGAGATWRLSFERPLRERRRAGEVALAVLGERSFDDCPSGRLEAKLATLLGDFDPTTVVVSRCGTKVGPLLMRLAGARGVPTIYHIDDDLFAVPPDLGPAKFAVYSSASRQHAMHECCRIADLVYCSTPRLKTRLGRFGHATPRLAGEIYCSADAPFEAFAPSSPPILGYMGTGGHATDLDMIVPAIEVVMVDRPSLRFQVFGSLPLPPRLVERFQDRCAHVPPTEDYGTFLARLGTLGWSVGLAPLKAIPFNSTKAQTKFVEYASAGIAVAASEGPVYGPIIADGAAAGALTVLDWAVAIERLLADPAAAASQVARSHDWLRDHADVRRHAEQVLAVFAEAERLAAHPDRASA